MKTDSRTLRVLSAQLVQAEQVAVALTTKCGRIVTVTDVIRKALQLGLDALAERAAKGEA